MNELNSSTQPPPLPSNYGKKQNFLVSNITSSVVGLVAGFTTTLVMNKLANEHGAAIGIIAASCLLIVEFGIVAACLFFVSRDFDDFKTKMFVCVAAFLGISGVASFRFFNLANPVINQTGVNGNYQSTVAASTAAYWNAGNSITGQDSGGDTMSKLREFASQIRNLPISNVDAEVVNHYTAVSECAFECADWLDELDRLEKAFSDFDEYSKSPDAFTESFLRGFLGDATGMLRELDSRKQRLIARLELFKNQRLDLIEKSRLLVGHEIRLRAYLSEKYRLDLPQGIAMYLNVDSVK